MTLTDLRYLIALANEKHFGRAAEKCHVSQPTLSVAIKKLEESFGVPLFERGTSEVRITETGHAVVVQARRVLQEAAHIQEIIAAGKDPLLGVLRLGVIYTIAPYLLPKLIPHVHVAAPQMPLVIQENFTDQLLASLKAGDLDVIIAALPLEEPGIVSLPIYEEPFRVMFPSDHAWKAQAKIHPEQLAEEKLLLLGTGNCFREQVLEACPACRTNSAIQRTLQGSSLETIRHMVATGVGVTVLPSTAADDRLIQTPLVQIRPFESPEPFRTVALAWRVTYPRNKAIDVLRQAIAESQLPGIRKINHS